MFRTFLMIILSLIFLVSTTVSAHSLLFFNKKTNSQCAQQKTAQPINFNIPNFSGNWSGSCQGQSELLSVTIEQSDSKFKMTYDDGSSEEYPLGGVYHHTNITKYGDNEFSQGGAFWNPNTNKLSINIVETSMKANSILPILADIISLNLSLENEKMTAEVNGRSFQGTEEDEPGHFTCIFSKE